MEAAGRAFAAGLEKYDVDNWAKGMPWREMLGSLLRHLGDFSRGRDRDAQSGLHPLDHAAACLGILVDYVRTGAGTDDRLKDKP